ncbi:hypothetical protein Bbelb_118170 [Branchiostoma belcheri]|nr:hypothetical protein Bbelb_118170 [Branchiostoma belcheri]
MGPFRYCLTSGCANQPTGNSVTAQVPPRRLQRARPGSYWSFMHSNQPAVKGAGAHPPRLKLCRRPLPGPMRPPYRLKSPFSTPGTCTWAGGSNQRLSLSPAYCRGTQQPLQGCLSPSELAPCRQNPLPSATGRTTFWGPERVANQGGASPPLSGPRRHSWEIRWEGGTSKQVVDL